MNDASTNSIDTGPNDSVRRASRWSRLCLKELRETLRDKRTLITLVLMPLLVYPILSMVFQRTLLSSLSQGKQTVVIGVTSKESADFLRGRLLVADMYLKRRTGKLADPTQLTAPSAEATAVDSDASSASNESAQASNGLGVKATC